MNVITCCVNGDIPASLARKWSPLTFCCPSRKIQFMLQPCRLCYLSLELVSFAARSFQYLQVPRSMIADHKEGRVCPVYFQHIEDPESDQRMRRGVNRQRHHPFSRITKIQYVRISGKQPQHRQRLQKDDQHHYEQRQKNRGDDPMPAQPSRDVPGTIADPLPETHCIPSSRWEPKARANS
jgi:hypothetical protein